MSHVADCGAAVDAQAAPGAAPHRVPLPGGEWQVWRTVVVRGAGFAAETILPLGAPAVAAAADAYSAAVAQRIQAVAAALEDLRRHAMAHPERRPQLRAIERELRRHPVDPARLDEHQRDVSSAVVAEAAARAALQSAYRDAARDTHDALSAIVSGARFREALLWQNPTAFRHAVASLTRHADDKKYRQAAEFLALVTQRYAVKNDTYSFFGPVGWASIEDASFVLRQRPGEALVSHRDVFFEGWAIDVLADTFASDPQLKPWTAPRRSAGAWIGADAVYSAAGRSIHLSAFDRRVLSRCDGVRTADAIASEIGDGDDATADEVFQALTRLETQQLIAWRLEVASQLRGEEELARRIAAIGDPATRARCVTALSSLVTARDEVGAASGDGDRLEAAFDRLNTTFTQVTGRPATRRAGETYAARTLVYEDCRRSGHIALGSAFVDAVGPPLSIVLDATRWLVGEVAVGVDDLLRRCHQQLRQHTRRDAIDAHAFLSGAVSFLSDGDHSLVRSLFADVERRYQAAWTDVLTNPVFESSSRLAFDTDASAARARRVFEARREGWSLACHLAPDVMIAAKSASELKRGQFECVLGEIHCSNTTRWSLFASQHPNPDALIAAVDADLAGRVAVMMQMPKSSWLARTNPAAVPASVWRYQTGPDIPSASMARPLPSGQLVAIDAGDSVKIRARDGSFECDAVELFGQWLSPMTSRVTRHLRCRSTYTPRITIGRLTIVRERWEVEASTLPFVQDEARDLRFAAVRAWARAHGMPRFVFYKTPAEPKPCYLDFASPLFVGAFVRMAKKAAISGDAVRVVEMLPRADQTWLVDAAGARYTSELRMVACRPAPQMRRDPFV
jgi:hypothetical protein